MPARRFETFLKVTYDDAAFRSLRHEYNSRNFALRKIGFEGSELGYDSYLASPRWLTGGRATYARSSRPQRCYVCGDPKYEVHHRSYKSLGRERLNHLVALCRRHHSSVHTLA